MWLNCKLWGEHYSQTPSVFIFSLKYYTSTNIPLLIYGDLILLEIRHQYSLQFGHLYEYNQQSWLSLVVYHLLLFFAVPWYPAFLKKKHGNKQLKLIHLLKISYNIKNCITFIYKLTPNLQTTVESTLLIHYYVTINEQLDLILKSKIFHSWNCIHYRLGD